MWPDGRTTSGSRRGSILLIAMVCLMLLMLMIGAVLQVAQATRAQVRRDGYRSQAKWLADSGASRAVASLALNPGYTGETWSVSASELSGDDPARVQIDVIQDGAPRVQVIAEYPAEGPDKVHYEESWPLTMAAPKTP